MAVRVGMTSHLTSLTQMCGATKNSARMRAVYPKTLDLEAAAIADPRVMG